MDIDPHTLQQILQRIHQQMRCPQCGKRVPVDFSSVQVVDNDAMLLQLKCELCSAYIVLHASLQGSEQLDVKVEKTDVMSNASSTFQMGEKEVKALRETLQESGGSFDKLFKEEADTTSE